MSSYFTDNDSTAAGRETASVSAGGLYVFDRELSKAQKADVLHSTLLAQIEADKNYDRTNDADNWYHYYVYRLGKIGWMAHDFDFDKRPFNNSITAGQFVVDRLKSELGFLKSKNVELAVNSIKKMSDDEKALQVFSSKSSSGPRANFQVGYCSSSDGSVGIELGAFVYHIDRAVKNPMSSKLKNQSTDARSAFQKMTLNKYDYDRVRDSVLRKLGDYANDYVADVPM
ncbi:hypothetical protein FRC08_001884 [Ceratobasidium sp. 394]|nr:hypothetical protein FRC08_001884 [Ceratobasidium sp. 394]